MVESEYNGYKVRLVESDSDISSMLSTFNPKISCGIDVETSGLSFISSEVAGVCISGGSSYSPSNYAGYYLPVSHIGYQNLPVASVVNAVQFVLDNYKCCFFNRPFDATFLEKLGVIFPSTKPSIVGKTHDVQQMVHLIKGESLPSLKESAKIYLKFDVLEFSSNNAKNNDFRTTDPRVSYRYASQDPLITTLLGRHVWASFPYIRKIYPLDNLVNEAMRKLSLNTLLPLDKSLIERELSRVINKQYELRQKIYSLVGYEFRLTSTQDKAQAISQFVTLSAKTRTGKKSVDKDTLEKLKLSLNEDSNAYALVSMLLEYSKLQTYRSSFLEKLFSFADTGIRIHYSTVNVATGRLSSGGSHGNDYYAPQNIQNIPKVEVYKYVYEGGPLGYYLESTPDNPGCIGKMKVKSGLRDAFICPEGYVMLNADYSSQEMRVMACLSGEPNLIEPIKNGLDIHNYIAKQMFGFEDPAHRTKVKVLNFAVNYGGGASTIASKLNCSVEEGQALLDRYNSTLSRLTAWKQEMVNISQRQGMVFTYFGRPRVLYQYYTSSQSNLWAFANRSAINSPVQGFGGDLIRSDHVKLYSRLLTDPEFRENVQYASTVHDEISIFVKPDYLRRAYEILTEIMDYNNPQFPISIPTSPACGVSWGSLIDIKGITPDNRIIIDESKLIPI